MILIFPFFFYWFSTKNVRKQPTFTGPHPSPHSMELAFSPSSSLRISATTPHCNSSYLHRRIPINPACKSSVWLLKSPENPSSIGFHHRTGFPKPVSSTHFRRFSIWVCLFSSCHYLKFGFFMSVSNGLIWVCHGKEEETVNLETKGKLNGSFGFWIIWNLTKQNPHSTRNYILDPWSWEMIWNVIWNTSNPVGHFD